MVNMRKVIMIGGAKRAGKDFISSKLKELIDGSMIMSFAEPMKDIVATTMGVSKEMMDKHKNNPDEFLESGYLDGKGFSTNFRSILQQFGSEAMKKHFGDDVWANLLVSKMHPEGIVIISDFRFYSEYRVLCKEADVTTIQIVDNNLINDDRHVSERDLDNFVFDYVIDNTNKDDSYVEQLQNVISGIGLVV